VSTEDGKQEVGVASARVGDVGGPSVPKSWVAATLVPEDDDDDDDSQPGLEDEDEDDVPSIPIIPAHV